MATTENTLNAKIPKDLPAKKPVKGGFVIDGRGIIAGDPNPNGILPDSLRWRAQVCYQDFNFPTRTGRY